MRKILVFAISLIIFSCFGILVYSHTTTAVSGFWQWYCGSTNSSCSGYFSGQTPKCMVTGTGSCLGYSNDVLPGGIAVTGASTGCAPGSACANFITTVQDNLFSGGNTSYPNLPSQSSCAGAFIVDMMLAHGYFGSNCQNGINTAVSTYNTWVSLVQSYASPTAPPGYGVNWDLLDNPSRNSAWFSDVSDGNISGDEIIRSNVYTSEQGVNGGCEGNITNNGYYCNSVYPQYGYSGPCTNYNCTIPVIQFYAPGNQTFEIERACGNLVGNLDQLPTILQPSCTLTASGSGVVYTFTTTVQNVSSPNYTFSFGDGSNYGPTSSSSTNHTYNSYGSFTAQVVVNGTSGGQPASTNCSKQVNIAVPAGCAYQAQPGVYGGQSTLSVCCTDNPSSTADYTVVGGFSGSVPNKSNLPANDPTPLLSIGSPTYQLVSGNPYGSGGSQPTGQTFSDTTGSSLAATYIEPYVSQSVSWSGSITASYQSYTVYNYEYPNNPNLPYQPNPYLPNYNPYDYGSYPSYAPITLPKGGKITSSQNIQPTYTVPFTGQPSVNTIAPCVTMSCGNYSVTAGLAPDPLDPQMSFSINVGVANNYGATPPGSMSLHISPVNGGSYNYNGQQGTSYGAGYTTTSVFSNLGPTNSTGQYQYTWTLTGPNVSQTCGPQPFQVVDLPYLQVYGGDVMAGTSPSDNSSGVSSCAYDTNAGIYGWNGLGAYSYAGAGAQYAVQALAQIDGFASSQYSSNSPPTALSFSNAGTDPLSGLFGTNFSGTIGDCNFTRNITTQPLIGDQTLPGTLSNGITVPSTPIPDGQPGQIIVYVQGNVYINNNITYNLSGWSSPSDIPYFKLIVVAGNIYIGSNVTQLDGLYVTEPSTSGQGGTIYTCASANNAPITPTSAGYYGTCKNQLTINGAFVAAQVQFLRTYGTVGQSSTDNGTPSGSHAAEVFNYTPELWLPRSGANPNGDYSAITGLPPTL